MQAAARARRGRQASCFTLLSVVTLIACTWRGAAGGRAPSHEFAPAAAQTFLKLISGYDVGDGWPLRRPQSASAGRREPYRVAGLPVLLLPVAMQDTRESDLYEASPYRGRLDTEFDGEEESDWSDWAPRRAARPRPPAPADDADADEHAGHFVRGGGPRRPARRERLREPADTAPARPSVPPVESSQRLVEQFRAQVPSDPTQPAILQSAFDGSERSLLVDDGADGDDGDDGDDGGDDDAAREPPAPPGGRARPKRFVAPAARGSPPRPRWSRPLKLRAVLTVPRADFSETYTAWWNPQSGDSRIHFQDGSAGTFRKLLPNGLVQRVEMHVDRSSGRALRRCAVSTAAAAAEDRAHPALPDLQLFAFAGYDEHGAERWQHRADAAAAAGGEALSALHELLLRRERDDSVRPLRYSVAVNSSVLGADCDGYQHLYLDARYHNRGPEFFEADLELCDELQRLNASAPDARARLEPLREFTQPQRDARHDAALQRYKRQHERQYADEVEEAVRKNLLMQNSRFVASGNRAGATFRLGLNFLGDRLDAELGGLRGVARDGERRRAEPFPHARRAMGALQRRLPAAFDWRARGGVSPVRFQGATCASCWAFAAAGAVEGALFRRSGRLTPLSEQQLVDCAHEFGARGCGGTWPSRAYDYVQARGLAALDDYEPYKGQVGSCGEHAVAPAARISGHVNVTKHSVPALQVAIQQHGPAVVIVDSSPKSFTLYKAGVLYDERCSKKSSKHAVLAVGWGQEEGEPHFILKNSWSDAWGERGYVRVQGRANTCGVLTHPSYPRLEDDDVL